MAYFNCANTTRIDSCGRSTTVCDNSDNTQSCGCNDPCQTPNNTCNCENAGGSSSNGCNSSAENNTCCDSTESGCACCCPCSLNGDCANENLQKTLLILAAVMILIVLLN
ncbi:MAG: hypothetical protein J6M12_00350 [Clostridia bacterium]|nr:hypothetical protein [Clostridia bacterium]